MSIRPAIYELIDSKPHVRPKASSGVCNRVQEVFVANNVSLHRLLFGDYILLTGYLQRKNTFKNKE